MTFDPKSQNLVGRNSGVLSLPLPAWPSAVVVFLFFRVETSSGLFVSEIRGKR